MKKILLILLLMLTSCTTSPTPHVENTKPLNYTAKMIRVYPETFEETYPKYYVFSTLEAFQQFYQDEGQTLGGYVNNEEILDVTSKYTDEYFNNHSLVVLLLMESSGSIRHQIESIKLIEKSLQVNVVKRVPAIGTSDIGHWSIFIEINQQLQLDTELEVKTTTTEIK